MKTRNLVLALTFTFLLPISPNFAANSASQTYKVSFTIPASVTQQPDPDPKSLMNKQQLSTIQKEVRAGQMVKIQSIVVP